MSDETQQQGGSMGGLLRHSSIYAIAPIAQRLLAVVLIHFYTDRLSTPEWGILGLTDLLLGLLPILLGTSLLAGLSRHYFLQKSESDRGAVVTTVLAAVLCSSTAISAVGMLLREPLARALFSSATAGDMGQYVDFVVLCLCIFPLALVTAVGVESLQIQKRSRAVVKVTLAKTLLEAGLKLYFLFVLDLGVTGFLLAVLAGETLAAVGLGAYVLRRFGRRLSVSLVAPLARYSGPLVPVAVFQLGLHQADKLLIERLGPDTVVAVEKGQVLTEAMRMLGVYAFGYQLPFILHVALMGSFVKIWLPSMFGAADEERVAAAPRVGTLVLLVLAFFYGTLGLFADEAIRLLASKEGYWPSAAVVPWIACAYLGYGAYALGQACLMSRMATRTLAWINGAGLAANLGLNVLLVPRYGIHGAAGATLASFALLALLAHRASTARGLEPLRLPKLAAAFALVAALGLAGTLVTDAFSPWSTASLAAKATIAALGAAVALALMPRDQRAALLARLPGRGSVQDPGD